MTAKKNRELRVSTPVTLYRVRRPDGTVIEAPPKDHRYSAVVSASYSEPQLSNLILAADDDQKFDDYLRLTGYIVEPVQYVPLEVAQKLAEALGNLFSLVSGECPSLLEDDHHYSLRESGVIE